MPTYITVGDVSKEVFDFPKEKKQNPWKWENLDRKCMIILMRWISYLSIYGLHRTKELAISTVVWVVEYVRTSLKLITSSNWQKIVVVAMHCHIIITAI